jgi:hypothetical protein
LWYKTHNKSINGNRKKRVALFQTLEQTNMLNRNISPYIAYQNRLEDLIAAIQVLGTYGFASRELYKWEARLGRKPVSAENWLIVFKQHPEFFTIQDENISLVWRRSRERNYDTYEQTVVSRDNERSLREKEKTSERRLSRPPLNATEVSQLIDIAIRLHEREIQHRQERRWWVTAVIAIIGLIVSVASN